MSFLNDFARFLPRLSLVMELALNCKANFLLNINFRVEKKRLVWFHFGRYIKLSTTKSSSFPTMLAKHLDILRLLRSSWTFVAPIKAYNILNTSELLLLN